MLVVKFRIQKQMFSIAIFDRETIKFRTNSLFDPDKHLLLIIKSIWQVSWISSQVMQKSELKYSARVEPFSETCFAYQLRFNAQLWTHGLHIGLFWTH